MLPIITKPNTQDLKIIVESPDIQKLMSKYDKKLHIMLVENALNIHRDLDIDNLIKALPLGNIMEIKYYAPEYYIILRATKKARFRRAATLNRRDIELFAATILPFCSWYEENIL